MKIKQKTELFTAVHTLDYNRDRSRFRKQFGRNPISFVDLLLWKTTANNGTFDITIAQRMLHVKFDEITSKIYFTQ